MNGKGFPEMLKRQAAAEEAAQARLAKIKAEQLQKEQEERDRRKLEVEAKRKKLAQDAKNQLSWSELQKIQEETRRDRIERHKQKLAQESALPNSLAESLKRMNREPPVENKIPAGANEFRAEDPAKVTLIKCVFGILIISTISKIILGKHDCSIFFILTTFLVHFDCTGVGEAGTRTESVGPAYGT